MISVAWRYRIITGVAAVLAVWLGTKIAAGEYFLPGLVGGTLAALALARALPIPLTTFLLGLALVGYVVGNRGFAQISVTGSLPILPAEFVLFVGGIIAVSTSAIRRQIPVRRDFLNMAIVVWVATSSVRIVSDLNTYGVMALRDFATVYYAAFFFLAQEAGRSLRGRGFLMKCLTVAFVALLLIYPAYMEAPDFFLDHFLVRGVPLIYYKGDLLGTFLAVGSILAFARFESTGSRMALALSLVMAAETMTSNNRASMLALIIPAVILAVGKRPRFLASLTACGVAGALAILLWARVQGRSWEETPVHEIYERAVSLADPYGERNYSGGETSVKGDNNVFRSTWWRIVIDETIHTNPWLGLGWGHDLAEEFVRVYYPENGEEFSVRSPHNIFITTFARTGVLGLLPFLALVYGVASGTWRSVKARAGTAGLWLAALAILISATFGVVLEGPMGAVLFWSLLGLAQSPAEPEDAPQVPESPVAMVGPMGSESVD